MSQRRLRRSFYGLAVAGSLLSATGWAQTVAAVTTPEDAPAAVATHTASADLDSPARPSQFVLGAADAIRINVWKNTDLSQSVTIGPDGFVSLPLLGDVHAAGLTANQLAQDLSARLGAFVVSPQVTVSVVEIRSRQVYVLGQVGKPGGYPLLTPTTVLQLIAQAGGLNVYANRKGILIIRESSGNTQRLKFNYASAINGDDKQNISLQPGDTVVVR